MVRLNVEKCDNRFKPFLLEISGFADKIDEKLFLLQSSSVSAYLPEVRRNLKLAFQYLEYLQSRLRKVSDALDEV